MLHGIHCIQSRFMESSAFNRDAFDHAAWSTLHSITMHGIHCIPSGCFGPCCIKSTAFNRDALGLAAWTPLQTIRIYCATMLGILAFIEASWNPLYSIGMLWACCIKSTAFNHAAWNPLHSIGFHFFTLNGIQCMQSRCIDST